MGQNVYTQRRPEKTALYQLVRDHYSRFQLSYNEKYAQEYRFFRPEIEREIEKFQRLMGSPKGKGPHPPARKATIAV